MLLPPFYPLWCGSHVFPASPKNALRYLPNGTAICASSSLLYKPIFLPVPCAPPTVDEEVYLPRDSPSLLFRITPFQSKFPPDLVGAFTAPVNNMCFPFWGCIFSFAVVFSSLHICPPPTRADPEPTCSVFLFPTKFLCSFPLQFPHLF